MKVQEVSWSDLSKELVAVLIYLIGKFISIMQRHVIHGVYTEICMFYCIMNQIYSSVFFNCKFISSQNFYKQTHLPITCEVKIIQIFISYVIRFIRYLLQVCGFFFLHL